MGGRGKKLQSFLLKILDVRNGCVEFSQAVRQGMDPERLMLSITPTVMAP